MEDLPKKHWAAAYFNGDFFCIETCSGLRGTAADLEGAQHLMPPDTEDETLGSAVLDALGKSRMISVEEVPVFFDYERLQKQYNDWVTMLIERYRYKTKRGLFKNMKLCNMISQNGVLTIRPSHHDQLEGWGGKGITKEDHVVIDAKSSPVEVGAALRLAFSRCTG